MSQLKLKGLIYVEWLDSAGCRGWHGEKDINNSPAHCRTVGWLYLEDKRAITLVPTHSEYEDSSPSAMDPVTIPKGCIQRRVKLADPSRKRRRKR